MADILPFAEWRPDLSPYKSASSQSIKNVLPRADGYQPLKSFSALTAALPAGNDTYTKALLPLNGADASTTITDDNAGGSAHTWTAAGNAQIDTAQSKFGGASLLCDGTGDWVSTPDHADFTLTSKIFTIECWIRPAGADGTDFYFAGQAADPLAVGTRTWTLLRQGSSSNHIQAVLGGAATQLILEGTTAVIAGAWYHIRFVGDGTTAYLFVNGSLEDSEAISFTPLDSSDDLRVGAGGELATSSWNGWIDEFRFDVGVARSTSTFIPNGGPYDTEASAICRGLFYARKTDGSINVFAGTLKRLWLLDNTILRWDEVSQSATAYASLPATHHWQFAQFGSIVIAVKPSTNPQAFTLGSSTAFADLSGSPPQAAFIAIVGRFVVLSGLTSNPFRIHWSALGSAVGWTQGTNSSDFQDLPDGGIVRGVAGGEYGVIFQETAMRRMVYQPGSVVIFSIEKITDDKGLVAPYSLIRAGEKIFWLAAQGFHGMTTTGIPEAIGKEKFDRFFFGNYDSGNLQLVIGASDPEGTRVFWAFKSSASSGSVFDFIICYDYGLGRATLIEQSGEYLASLAAPGITLENLDSISASIDALSQSLDDISTAALAKLSMVNTSHVTGFFSGSNIEATLDTSEQAGGRRFRVKGFRPITDAATCYGSVGSRETVQAATRAARGRLRIPASTTWTFATGVEPEFVQEGHR